MFCVRFIVHVGFCFTSASGVRMECSVLDVCALRAGGAAVVFLVVAKCRYINNNVFEYSSTNPSYRRSFFVESRNVSLMSGV